jgi:hypothetical protein
VKRLLRLAERVGDDEHPISVRGGEHAPAIQLPGSEGDSRQDVAAPRRRHDGRIEERRKRDRIRLHDPPVRADDLGDHPGPARVRVEQRAVLRVGERLRGLCAQVLVDRAAERVLDAEIDEAAEREEKRRH